jgi:hypothetical protein
MRLMVLLFVAAMAATTGEAQAGLATRAQCVAACDPAVADLCGWIAKRGKFNRCRAKLYNRCKRFGVAVTCPAPPPPPPPPTTPTTLAPLPPPPTTTTTTVPRPTTTTTTLPAIRDLRGTYQFEGYVTEDPCGLEGLGAYFPVPFGVTNQVSTNLSGYFGANALPATGTYTPATGGWNLGSSYCQDGCCFQTGIGVGNDEFSAAAVFYFEGNCSLAHCYVEAAGLVYRY